MSLSRRVKLSAAAALALTLAACSSPAPDASSQASSEASSTSQSTVAEVFDQVKVLCPQGAPALATIGFEQEDADVDYVEGQDMLMSELTKTDGEYDMIIAPVNVGIKTWKEAQAYEMAGILTWGNLYVVSADEDWNEPDKTIALFGEGAVPGLVFDSVFPDLKATGEYYPSVAEASAALIGGKADAALLAQPAAAGAINKASQNDVELAIVDDLQQMWQEQHETARTGYPQAALFVRKGDADKCAHAMDQMKSFIDSADTARVEEAVELLTPETLGVPSAKLAAATWQQQNIHFEPAADVKEDLQKFLDVFGMQIPDGLILE